MAEDTTTPFETRCEILSDFWMDYKNNPKFQDFMEYNDLGLPLSYAIATDVVPSSKLAENFINETFEMLIGLLGLEDTGFESLEDLFHLGSI